MSFSTPTDENLWVVDGPVDKQDPAFVDASERIRDSPKLYLRSINHAIHEEAEDYNRAKAACKGKYPPCLVKANWILRSHYMRDTLWLAMNGRTPPTANMGGTAYLQKFYLILQEDIAKSHSLALVNTAGPRSVLYEFENEENEAVDADTPPHTMPAISARPQRSSNRQSGPATQGLDNDEGEKEEEDDDNHLEQVDIAIFPRCIPCIEVHKRVCDRAYDQVGRAVCSACRADGGACQKEPETALSRKKGYYGRLTGIMITRPLGY